ITIASHIAGAFPSVCQSCTSSTLLPRRPKIAPHYATLPLTFIVVPALNHASCHVGLGAVLDLGYGVLYYVIYDTKFRKDRGIVLAVNRLIIKFVS
ncbi:hypothetical protein, partial [uncultured Muribaculum sp.]|uniref:hypothetical protein n=6 Tax=uncultured Muribaculum sp. TaxID=1918613 RepID=UPI0025A5A81F